MAAPIPVEGRVLAICFAVTLQLTVTPPIGAHGVRVAVSDLLLPAAALVVWRGWQLRPSSNRLLAVPGWPWWLGSITAAMTIALFVGNFTTGTWSSWAVINKYAGWFILMAYLFVGAALSQIFDRDFRHDLIGWFTATAAVVAAVSAAAFPMLHQFGTAPVLVTEYRLIGFSQNSNAFGFLLAVAFALTIATAPQSSRWIYAPVYLVGLWFTASRGAMLAAIVAGIAVAILRVEARKNILLSVAGAVVIAGALSALTARVLSFDNRAQPLGLISTERADINSFTIIHRRSMTARAIALFKNSPLFGVGLGGYMWTANKEVADKNAPRTIHNSALWLITELGLLGAAPFIGFLIACIVMLWRQREDPVSLGLFAVAVAFIAISVTGEYLYQRQLWFLLGMALAVPTQEETWQNTPSASP